MSRHLLFAATIVALFSLNIAYGNDATSTQPNIVVVLCDDLGYGDVQPNNPESQIATPSFNRLAKEGVNFTDAHSGSGVCTPTRYGLVCGRYAWRTHLKRGVLGGYSKPLIDQSQQTIGQVLKKAGYTTGCVGKWHLGLGWQWRENLPKNINNFGIAGGKGMVDYSKPLNDGPNQHGFDYSYIIPASLDMSPYVYIENDAVTSQPNKVIPGKGFPAFYRKGEIADDFKIIDTLDHLTEKATNYIAENAKRDQPYFLYVPLPAPHKPVIPTESFQGKSNLGQYGDFIMQVDDSVGRIIQAIDDSGERDNTFLIVTSDNGSFMHRYDKKEAKDHTDQSNIQGYRPENHRPNGPLRGTKADVWEAGHRVPFFVRWPQADNKIQEVRHTICHVDILATAAQLAGAEFDKTMSPDSYSFLDSTNGKDSKVRPPVIHHSAGGMFAIRHGNWKLVLGSGSGGRAQPKGKPFEKPYHLFDMSKDIGEKDNLIADHPEIEKQLTKMFEQIADGDQFPVKSKPTQK